MKRIIAALLICLFSLPAWGALTKPWGAVHPSGVFNVMSFGAVADSGTTDNTTPIQAAIDAAAAVRGVVYVPPAAGWYGITSTLTVPSNVYVVGEGPASHIKNTGGTSYTTNVFQVGNYGGYNQATGATAETQYAIDAATAGDKTITLTTAGDSANFTAGDLVSLRSTAVFSGSNYKYTMVNKVLSVGTGTVTLEYPIGDDYGATSEMAVLSTGSVTGLDGQSAYMVENSGLVGLKLENATVDGWSVFHASGYKCVFRDLTLVGPRSFGANPVAFSTFENIDMSFYVVGGEITYYHNNIVLKNITGRRIGSGDLALDNLLLQVAESGSDVLLDGFFLDDGIYTTRTTNGVYVNQSHRTTVRNGTVVNGLGYGILVGAGCEDTVLEGNRILNPRIHGIYFNGTRGHISNNTVRDTPAGYNAIYLGSSSSEVTVRDNKMGTPGATAVADTIFDALGRASSNHLAGNTGHMDTTYDNQSGNIADYTTAATTAVYTRTVTATTWSDNAALHIKVAGNVNGTNGAKTITLKLGTSTLATVSMASGEADNFIIELDLYAAGDKGNQRGLCRAYQADALEESNYISSVVDTNTTDLVFTLNYTLANASDTIVTGPLVFDLRENQVDI